MNLLYDSGISRRYSKFASIQDKEFQELLKIANKHKHNRHYKSDEYKFYKDAAAKILKDTSNYREKAIVLNKKREIVFEKLGTARSVSFTNNELAKMKYNYLIHNHPSGSTLSEQDVQLALDNKLKEIVAFSAKGNYFRLVIKNNPDVTNVMLEYTKARKKVSSVLFRLINSKLMTKEHATAERQHFIMSVFSDNLKDITYENSKY